MGITSAQVQDFACPFLELHKGALFPFLQPVEVPLSGSTPIWEYQPLLPALCHTCRDAFCLVIQVISEDLIRLRCWPRINPWGAPQGTSPQLQLLEPVIASAGFTSTSLSLPSPDFTSL